jgi:hypothetical protein
LDGLLVGLCGDFVGLCGIIVPEEFDDVVMSVWAVDDVRVVVAALELPDVSKPEEPLDTYIISKKYYFSSGMPLALICA